MERGQNVSLRQAEAGKSSPAALVSRRLAVIRADYIGLVPDALICEERAREWGITRRQVKRYLTVVKARYARERTDADADFLRQLEGVVVANIQRARDTEQAAVDATKAIVVGGSVEYVSARDFRAECAAQAQELRGVERLCAMRGLDAARKVEVRTETQQQARQRILSAVRSKGMTADSETKGEA